MIVPPSKTSYSNVMHNWQVADETCRITTYVALVAIGLVSIGLIAAGATDALPLNVVWISIPSLAISQVVMYTFCCCNPPALGVNHGTIITDARRDIQEPQALLNPPIKVVEPPQEKAVVKSENGALQPAKPLQQPPKPQVIPWKIQSSLLGYLPSSDVCASSFPIFPVTVISPHPLQ